MKYMTVSSFMPEDYKAAQERFFEEKEPLAFRLSELGTMKGFYSLETDGPAAMSRFDFCWANLADMKTVPVVDDGVTAKALSE